MVLVTNRLQNVIQHSNVVFCSFRFPFYLFEAIVYNDETIDLWFCNEKNDSCLYNGGHLEEIHAVENILFYLSPVTAFFNCF